MKCVFLSVAVLLLLNGAHSLDLQFMEQMVQCGQEMGVTADQIKDMIANKDEKLGCINACTMKKLGALVDGKLNLDNMFGIIDKNKDTIPDPEKMREVVQSCHDEAASAGDLPECQLAGKFSTCLHAQIQG